jgi:crotonobetainyl-CoA:carnitine CoA-transferase CaiB-like acyl-CoA transferase
VLTSQPELEALSSVPFRSDAKGPLSGLRVVDLTRLVCGNVLTLMLADFGADVIKIEDPEVGDPLRAWKVDGKAFYWKVYGRNKRSIALNLKSEAGRRALLELTRTADCVVESFRFGTLERLGIGPDVLMEANPKLVVVRVSGWGQTGPYRARPGFGTLVEAFSGFASKTGFEDKPPLLPNMPLADQVAGLTGAFATVVALRHAERTGEGQVVDVSLLEPMHAILGPDAAIHAATGEIPVRTGSRALTTAPRNIYPTSDGQFLALSAAMQSMAERLLKMIGGDELANDPRFRTSSTRVANIEVLDEIVGGWIEARTLDENLAIFEKAGITAGPVYDPPHFAADEHVREREVLVRVPDEELGEVVMHNVLPRLTSSPGALRMPAPSIGQHTAEILAELGLSLLDHEGEAAARAAHG